ncbi:MAG: DEAD/DEAH box helicase [Deltaproteobacteria bacterium]|nr:MAG: DEAD/DEAH box helicase [Deltaproteobacteria bacterium]
MRVVRFHRGTLVVEGSPADELPQGFTHDPRIGAPRGYASAYRQVLLDLHRRKIPYRDEARAYAPLERAHRSSRSPRDYQREAVQAWRDAGRCGTVLLPTGAGKSFVAELCIAEADRSVLVVAPTLDLVGQWYDGLRAAFGDPVGVLGGGVHQVEAITVATYDSAWMHMDRYGDRFGLLIFDEVHHLPGPSYAQAALLSLAPFRLGLTATLERPDGGHERVFELVGPVVYRREITELAGDFLAEYHTEVVLVHLSAEERRAYDEAYGLYRRFIEENNIRLGGPGGWANFLRVSAASSEGRRAFKAWSLSRRLMHGAEAKLRVTSDLLRRHADRRILIFTNDNATAYEISRRLLVPVITHQTDLKERQALLEGFGTGALPVLATSRVLNEGVDLPSADVAIVLSGTQTVREHVQRLGRILRKQEGKQAILYELVVADTTEQRQSARRRDHVAYRDP